MSRSLTRSRAPKAPAAPAKAARAAAGVPTYATVDAKLKEAFWKNPDDHDLLRVWTDSLLEKGDPRGEYILLQLIEDPTEEQLKRTHALEKKAGGKLVGPAREWLHSWSFDSQTGLVDDASVEAQKLIDGWEEIAWLNPRLTLSITFKKQMVQAAAKLGALPLSRFRYIRMESSLTDSAIAKLGPGLRGVKNLSLAHTFLTPQGLAAIAPYLGSLECLCVGPHVSDRAGSATCNAFAEVIATTPALHHLEVVYFCRHGQPDAAHVKMLEKLPKMKKVVVSESMPNDIYRYKMKDG